MTTRLTIRAALTRICREAAAGLSTFGKAVGTGLLALALLLLTPLCAAAQNNPYKINNLLYREFNEAYTHRNQREGLDMARNLYAHAARLGDRKAQCLALTIPVTYYTALHTDEAAFERALKELQDTSLKYGYEQYYYFGVTNRVNFLINNNRKDEAFGYVSDIEAEARRRKSPYGSFTALNALGQLHVIRSELGLAIDCYRKALQYGNDYLRDQDMAQQYRKIAECYESLYDYRSMLSYAERGHAVARTANSRLLCIRGICYAAFMLRDRDRFARYYDIYTSTERQPSVNSRSLHEREIAIMKLAVDGRYDEALQHIGRMPKQYDQHKLTLRAEIQSRCGDLHNLAIALDTLYRGRIRGFDMVKDNEYDRLGSSIFNQLLAFENQRLALEQQRLANERQRTQIAHTHLQLANTQLSLKNSSLELHRTRTASDLMQLSYDRKRLYAERLRQQIKAQQAEQRLHHSLFVTLLAIGAVVIVAAALYMYYHRKMMRQLHMANQMLAVRHGQLIAARDRAEAAARAKTAFIQNMSEEIRQPLLSAVSCAHTIANSVHRHVPKQQLDEYNSCLQQSTSDMLKLVGKVLDRVRN